MRTLEPAEELCMCSQETATKARDKRFDFYIPLAKNVDRRVCHGCPEDLESALP